MRRIEPEHEPVEQPPTSGRPLNEQPIHLRRQPQDTEPLAECRLALRRLAVDAHRPPLALRPDAAGTDCDGPAPGGDGRGDGPARGARLAAVAPVDIAEPGIAQAAAGRQKGHRLQKIGFSGAVWSGQYDWAGIEIEPGRAVIAKIGEDEPGHADAPAARRQMRPAGAPAVFLHRAKHACHIGRNAGISSKSADPSGAGRVTRASASARRARWRRRRRARSSASRHPTSGTARIRRRSAR